MAGDKDVVEGATTPEAKRTRVTKSEEEEDAKPEEETKPSAAAFGSASAVVPSWLSAGATATSSSMSAAVPSWLSGGSSSSFGSASSSSAVPSWLSGGGGSSGGGGGGGGFGQSTAVFGGGGSSSEPSATFGALSSSSSVFGSKKDKNDGEDDNSNGEDEEGEGGEEDDNEDAAAAFGHDNNNGEDADAAAASPVETGEENETVLYQVRAKLFKLSKTSGGDAGGAWTEVGFGPLRVNVPLAAAAAGEGESTPPLARLVMRRQGVWTLLLNAPITGEFQLHPTGDKMLRVSCENFTGEETAVHTYLLRCSREDERDELVLNIKSAMPQQQQEAEDTPKSTGLVEQKAPV